MRPLFLSLYSRCNIFKRKGNNKMKKYPLKLNHITRSAIWGGNLLAEKWGREGKGDNIAESWELSVREEAMSIVQNGELAGMALKEVFQRFGYDFVSPQYGEGDRFPLLIKLIDARESLSVQVHPDDSYAERVEHDSGKTEMWYIVSAEKDSFLIYGLEDGVSREDYARAVKNGNIDGVMKKQKVKAGESYFIPAGMVHAIGGGILIAEIQQNSDLTYRVYDFNRRQKDGTLRTLHTEKALDVIRPYGEEEIEKICYEKGKEEDGELLANSRYFKVRKRELRDRIEMIQGAESFGALLCIDGEGSLVYDGESYPIAHGDSYFIPAGMGKYAIEGRMTLICSEL